ncbi:MAG TPA: response regulator [Candidatus Baltobacteraceae bacterium]|jgi:CheY-like chemotaxis protein|nr:response regulator [Candidatus Baltobacteraceae bacterium]
MILLVEDNEDDVFIMERVMLKLPPTHTMHVAVDGREAVDYLQGSGKYSDRLAYPIPSLIFLDLKLPSLHGFEVLAWINSQPSLKSVPVAILSSSAEPRDRETAIRLGAKSFLVKPPTPETVAQALKLLSDVRAPD